MTGRPSDYSDELANLICQRLADGESLNRICKDADMPSRVTVYNWLGDENKKGFLNKYVCAREAQADAIFDECLDIADNSTDDLIFLVSDDDDGAGGRPALKHSAIARAKLQIDTRMRMAGKLRPKKYGDKVALTGGDEDDNPIKVDAKVEIVHVTPT